MLYNIQIWAEFAANFRHWSDLVFKQLGLQVAFYTGGIPQQWHIG